MTQAIFKTNNAKFISTLADAQALANNSTLYVGTNIGGYALVWREYKDADTYSDNNRCRFAEVTDYNWENLK
jgi:hypothetical protein